MMRVFLIAGEPSGDLLGARLMAALKLKAPGQIAFGGVGGPRMEEQGLQSLFPMSDLTLFGLAELLPKIPNILRRLKETEAEIRRQKPDLVVTIDAPDFCFRIARRLKGSGIRFVHYVAPTVWAWREKRAQKIQPLLAHLLALFPFEPPYFERVGLPCSFVGHPLVEVPFPPDGANAFRRRHQLSEGQKLLVVLPGSRRSELSSLLPVFSRSLELVLAACLEVRVVVPTLPHLAETIRAATASWPGQPLIVTSDEDKYGAFAAAQAALAASGTVALELALANTPAVIAYRIHPLTYQLYRRLIKVRYANLVNIMADRMAVPEFLQTDCTPEKISAAVVALLSDPALCETQRETLTQVRGWLSPRDGQKPSQKAADVVLATLAGK